MRRDPIERRAFLGKAGGAIVGDDAAGGLGPPQGVRG